MEEHAHNFLAIKDEIGDVICCSHCGKSYQLFWRAGIAFWVAFGFVEVQGLDHKSDLMEHATQYPGTCPKLEESNQ